VALRLGVSRANLIGDLDKNKKEGEDQGEAEEFIA